MLGTLESWSIAGRRGDALGAHALALFPLRHGVVSPLDRIQA